MVITFTYISLHEGDSSKPHVPELKKIADETPLYPGFQKLGDDYIVLKDRKASLQRSFRTDAKFVDVRKFYDSALANAGWRPPEVPQRSIFVEEQFYVSYHRGPYEIMVARVNDRADVYAVAFIWYSQ